jgi:hypothetical protein
VNGQGLLLGFTNIAEADTLAANHRRFICAQRNFESKPRLEFEHRLGFAFPVYPNKQTV